MGLGAGGLGRMLRELRSGTEIRRGRIVLGKTLSPAIAKASPMLPLNRAALNSNRQS